MNVEPGRYRGTDDRPTQAWRPPEGLEARPREATREAHPPERVAERPGDRVRPAAGERRGASDAPTEAIRPGDVVPASPSGRPGIAVRRLRRGRLVIRKIDPWAVLKFSLVFYFCMLLIMLLGTAIIFAVLKIFGVIDNLEQLLSDLLIDVTIAGGAIFKWLFLVGLVGSIIASAITVFMAFLYNLIADVVGGIELLVTERE